MKIETCTSVGDEVTHNKPFVCNKKLAFFFFQNETFNMQNKS